LEEVSDLELEELPAVYQERKSKLAAKGKQ
jgi:hypothetical protein